MLKALPRGLFERWALPFAAGRRKRGLSGWNHLVAMMFAQASGTRSLRDLEQVVERHDGVARHVGLAGLKRSTLSDANRERPAGLFEAAARQLPAQLAGPGLSGETVRLIDATHVLAGRRIARMSGAGGVKLHLMYELESRRPVCFAITSKRVNDIVAANAMPVEAGAP